MEMEAVWHMQSPTLTLARMCSSGTAKGRQTFVCRKNPMVEKWNHGVIMEMAQEKQPCTGWFRG